MTKEEQFDKWLEEREYLYCLYHGDTIYIDGEVNKQDLKFLLDILEV